MRAANVDAGHELERGDAVEYSLAVGSMGVEAVHVQAFAVEDEGVAARRPEARG